MQFLLAMPEPDILLNDGDLVPGTGRRLRAVWTPGHTPGHLCLHEEAEDVLLTGDHVLPRITPNIAQMAHTDDPPLAAYLESLGRAADYDSAGRCPRTNTGSTDWPTGSGSSDCTMITAPRRSWTCWPGWGRPPPGR
jgi:glyoxylase-like metal-dependent hydrolase (beta-lactamase superfamily II)